MCTARVYTGWHLTSTQAGASPPHVRVHHEAGAGVSPLHVGVHHEARAGASPLHVGVHHEAGAGVVVDSRGPHESSDRYHNLLAVGLAERDTLNHARPLHYIDQELAGDLLCNAGYRYIQDTWIFEQDAYRIQR